MSGSKFQRCLVWCSAAGGLLLLLAVAVSRRAPEGGRAGAPPRLAADAVRARQDRVVPLGPSERAAGAHADTRRAASESVRNQPSHAISGRVQDERGMPILGARVCAVDPGAGCCAAAACTLSDAAGAFVLEGTSGALQSLFGSHAGYLPVTQSAVDPSSQPRIVLSMVAGGAAVAGSVLDAWGGPVAGAELRATDERNELVALGTSDADGLFRLDLPPGAALVVARAEGYSPDARSVQAPLLGVELRLAAAAAIVGHVVAEGTRSPVAGVLVSARSADGLQWAERASRSLADGSFTLPGLRPGRYSLTAAAERWRGDESWVVLEVAQTSGPLELSVRAAAQLVGVLQLGARPCTRGSVALQGPMQSAAQPKPDGSVVFDGLLPGSYHVSLACEGARKLEALEVGAERLQRVWSLSEGQPVAGAVLTQGGAGVAGVQVNVTPLGAAEGRGDAYCMTEADGGFSCEGLAPGEYQVQVASGVVPRALAMQVRVGAEAPPRVVLRTREEGAIRVRIDKRQSFDASTLSVLARAPNEAALPGQLRGDTVVFDAVPLGSYEVFIDSDPAGAAEHVTLTRDGQVAELTLAMPEPHRLRGRVVDDEGQAVPQAWVHASRAVGFYAALPTEAVLTDSDGAFTLGGLVPGHYTLAVHGSLGDGHLEGVASDSADALVRVRTFASLSGTLRNAAGALVDEFVLAYTREGSDSRDEVSATRGAWQLPWLAPGTYQLHARTAEGTAMRSVELLPGRDISIALQLDGTLGSTDETLQPQVRTPDLRRALHTQTKESAP